MNAAQYWVGNRVDIKSKKGTFSFHTDDDKCMGIIQDMAIKSELVTKDILALKVESHQLEYLSLPLLHLMSNCNCTISK